MKKKKIIAFIVANISIFCEESFAYFDPGTGTFIIQAIIAFVSAVIIYLGYPVSIIKKIIKKIKNKFSRNEKNKKD